MNSLISAQILSSLQQFLQVSKNESGKCRYCRAELKQPFLDLGLAPPSNAFLSEDQLQRAEVWFPLRLFVCKQCWLVQTEDYAGREALFNPEYAYFSSYSTTWLKHAEEYVEKMVERFGLGPHSYVVEIAANDGYLLQYVKARGIPCLGVEPTAGTAAEARKKGITIVEEFFGMATAERLIQIGGYADLMTANNVLAHVPDINDFVAGFSRLLKPNGVATFEFPHLLRLVVENQFDTVYHEHYSYLSLTTVQQIFGANGLTVFDVEELPTHGGSLRVFAQRANEGMQPISTRVKEVLERECAAEISLPDFYSGFQLCADQVKNDFIAFLIESKRAGKKVAAYGAAAKGNTLLNYAGVRQDLLSYVVDRNPGKQGKFLPGSRIPIVTEEHLKADQPDYVVILPWNLRDEIMVQLSYIKQWNGQFVTAVPKLEVRSPIISHIYYTKPSITEKEIAYATDAVRNGWGERCYEYISRFEEAFKAHLGVKYSIATSSCTGALHMGLAALGVGPGYEVIMADTNWIAVAAPIVHLGAKPVFVDILPDSWCIDPELAEAAITPRTKAIIAVHLYGNLCDMDRLLAIGQKHGIPIIEDAAEAIGSVYYGKRAGSMGIFGSFSFHGTKTLTTGEGGMFVTNDSYLYETVLTLSNHGRARGQTKQFWPDMVGYKYKMSNIQAAIGCGQMDRIEELVSRKRRIFYSYAHHLCQIAGVTMNPEWPGTQNGYWMPTVLFDRSLRLNRDMLLERFKAHNIDGRVFFCPLSSLPMFKEVRNNKVSYDIYKRALNLPSYHDITGGDIELVDYVIKNFLAELE